MEASVLAEAPAVRVVSVMSDAPAFDPMASAYLLAGVASRTSGISAWVAVVDPGVGTDRLPLAVKADGVWFLGPDNGLFELVMRRASTAESFRIDWRPKQLSASFHGRDLFAPVAARLSLGLEPERAGLEPSIPNRLGWPDDLARILYVDAYGNCWTGLRAAVLGHGPIRVAGMVLPRATTFGDVASGQVFWYENSCGLVEIAVNGGRACDLPGLVPGVVVTI